MMTHKIPLTQIATAQKADAICAYTRVDEDAYYLRGLVQAQRVYAAKASQLDALRALFDFENTPDISLAGHFSQMTLRLKKHTFDKIYDVLNEVLNQDLKELEAEIIRMQNRIKNELLEDASSDITTDASYPREIVRLCMQLPAVPASSEALAFMPESHAH